MKRGVPIVGVIGSGVREHADRAEPLGRWLAVQGVHLLTGGGKGVMESVSRAFVETPGRRGLVIGILPSDDSGSKPRDGYPNSWVEIPIVTHLPLSGAQGENPMSRNSISILSADVIVALPGGDGTASEIRLAVRHGRPLIAFVASREEIPRLPEEVESSDRIEVIQRFVSRSLRTCRRDIMNK